MKFQLIVTYEGIEEICHEIFYLLRIFLVGASCFHGQSVTKNSNVLPCYSFSGIFFF